MASGTTMGAGAGCSACPGASGLISGACCAAAASASKRRKAAAQIRIFMDASSFLRNPDAPLCSADKLDKHLGDQPASPMLSIFLDVFRYAVSSTNAVLVSTNYTAVAWAKALSS